MLYFCCKFVKACLFSCETLKYNFFAHFGLKYLDYASGGDIFCIFTQGAEAAFCGSPVRYLILRQVCRNKEIPEKFLKLPRFVRRYFFYILREHLPFLLWPNYLSPLLLIWLHTDCCLSAMATEPASSLLHLSPPLHACPPIKISGCKQVIFFAAICFMGLKISG